MASPRRVAALCLARAAARARGEAAAGAAGELRARAAGLEAALGAVVRGPERLPEPPLEELLGLVRAALGPRLGPAAAEELRAELGALASPDALVMVFGAAQDLLLLPGGEGPAGLGVAEAAAQVTRDGELGAFVRECCVAFDLLSFEGVCALWEEVRRYVARPGEATSATPKPLLPHAYGSPVASERQLQLLREKAATEPPDAFQRRAGDFLKAFPHDAQVHYLRFQNYLQHKNYTAAMDALHTYFDYSGGHHAALQQSDTKLGHFQNALLSMCAAHIECGNLAQAFQALDETLRMAQQQNDDGCLAHALAQLCHLLSLSITGHPSLSSIEGPEEQQVGFRTMRVRRKHEHLLLLLRRCLKRARDFKLPHLEAYAALSLARFNMLHSSNPLAAAAPAGAPAGLTVPKACQHVAFLHRETAVAATAGAAGDAAGAADAAEAVADGALKAGVAAAVRAVEGCVSSAGLLRATFEDLTGHPTIANSYFAINRKAFPRAEAGSRIPALVGNVLKTSALKGQAAADRLVAGAEGVEAERWYNGHFNACRLALEHQRATQAGDFHRSCQTAVGMKLLADADIGKHFDIWCEGEHRRVLSLLMADRVGEAYGAATALYGKCYRAGLQLECLKILMLLAKVHHQAGHSMGALPYLLSCLSQSRDKGFAAVECEASLMLAELWLDVGPGYVSIAKRHLDSCMIAIMTDATLEIKARAQVAHVKFALTTLSREELARDAALLQMLGEAAEAYGLLGARKDTAEVHKLRALIFNSRGDYAERDRAAGLFRQHFGEGGADCVAVG